MKVNLTDLKEQLIQEHNKIRENPKSYIEKLKIHLESYLKEGILTIPKEIKMKLVEGEKAYNDAINFLENLEPLKPLKHHDGLSKSAEEHAVEIGTHDLFTHESRDGSNTADRVEKYVDWDGACCESIEFGNISAENIIIALLIDDGIEHRPHRANMFSDELQYFGVGVSEHKSYRVVTVINYVAGIRDESGKVSFDYENFKYKIRDNVPHETLEEKQGVEKEKNPYQIDDPDAPDDTVSVQIVKKFKMINEKRVNVTRKAYKLSNGTYHIVEVEEQT